MKGLLSGLALAGLAFFVVGIIIPLTSDAEPVPIEFLGALSVALPICGLLFGAIVFLAFAVASYDATKSREENEKNYFVKTVIEAVNKKRFF